MPTKHRILHYPIFRPYKNLFAFTTTKQSLLSDNYRFTGDSPEVFWDNRKKLANLIGIKPTQLVFPQQTHTNHCITIKSLQQNKLENTDALITNQQGICICIQTADCVPVLLYDPENKVISAIHAGWRGTVTKIVEETLLKMKSLYGTNPEKIKCAIGPSISPEVYEVGNEVVLQVRESIQNSEFTLQKNNTGKFHLNLWEANKQLLLTNGVAEQNIYILGECSFLENKKYFSARREGPATGRMVSGIMLLDV